MQVKLTFREDSRLPRSSRSVPITSYSPGGALPERSLLDAIFLPDRLDWMVRINIPQSFQFLEGKLHILLGPLIQFLALVTVASLTWCRRGVGPLVFTLPCHDSTK